MLKNFYFFNGGLYDSFTDFKKTLIDHVSYFLFLCGSLCDYVKETNFVNVWGRVTKFSRNQIESELCQK